MAQHGQLPILETETTWWRSLAEYSGDPQFEDCLHREFPRGASELPGESRREFLKLISASVVLASAVGCSIRQPLEKIVPAARETGQTPPGISSYYTTALDFAGSAQGLTVECRDGRPFKIEGNPRHPASLGATSVFAQGMTLGLYDPDRARVALHLGTVVGPEHVQQMLAATRERCDRNGGQGLRVLIGASTSPTLERLLNQLTQRWPRSKWSVYEPVHDDNLRASVAAAFAGAEASASSAMPVYDFSKARAVLSIDFDFLSARDQPLCYVRQFANARRIFGRTDPAEPGTDEPPKQIDQVKLFHLGPSPTVTSSKADHCLFATPADVTRIAIEVARRLKVDVSSLEDRLPSVAQTGLSSESQAWIDEVVKSFEQAGPASIVAAGREQAPLVHWLGMAINARLDAIGRTVHRVESPQVRPPGQFSDRQMWQRLMSECESGEVDTLLILGSNPLQSCASQGSVVDAVRKVQLSVALVDAPNVTSNECQWLIPRTHFLEAWGDARAHDGTTSIVQPMLLPMHQSLSEIEFLSTLIEDARSGYEGVRKTWREQLGLADDDPRWRDALANGIIDGTTAKPMSLSLPSEVPSELLEDEALVDDSSPRDSSEVQGADAQRFELVLRPDPTVWDGRFANNGWLQELPKPLTHIVWDNAAWMAQADASRLGLSNGDVVAIGDGPRSVELPIWIVPGHASNCVTLFAGYGQSLGRVGMGRGFDLRPLFLEGQPPIRAATLTRTGRKFDLVTTQHHQLMEGRHLARAGTLGEYREQSQHPGFVQPDGPRSDRSLYPEWPYEGHKWGMSIDLTACVGCSACVIACQAENNIPVVGKDQCGKNRQMHWLRVDTYFQGTPAKPQKTLHQPVPCMHCERAPCELVCPVAATTHSADGLNQMVYNRCIGTRYCSNNCPYKVRRFNFLDYSKTFVSDPTMVLLSNPEVTLRSRGVMEKCTYCVQRIERGSIDAQLQDRGLRDGDIQTACQSACPARAIQFGDLNAPDSLVKQAHEHPLAYDLLEELNTRPRTRYLAEVFHP